MLKLSDETLFKFMSPDKDGNSRSVSCIASYTGDINRQGMVLFPGIWKNAIPHFITDGAIYVEHSYDRDSIGTAVSAIEMGNSLQLTWEFLDTEFANQQREIIRQRMERGKNHYMSNGFNAKWTWFENGELLLKYAERMGFDMNLFNATAIAAKDDYIGGIVNVPDDGWFESSVTDRPAIQQAGIKMLNTMREATNTYQFVSKDDLDKLLAETGSDLVTENTISDFHKQMLAHKMRALLGTY